MDCLLSADDSFGPAVRGCRNNFDFTLLFEQSIFQIAPCALLLLLLPVRASQLRQRKVKSLRTGFRAVKQLAIVVYAATQLALLVVWSVTPMYRTRASIPAATLSFLASLALLLLSSVEHTRSIRPSTLINVYMLISLLLDIPQARTLWLRSGPKSVPGIYSVGLATKTCILWLEARSKRRSLFPQYLLYGPETVVSCYDRTVMWWLNPLFLRGYRSIIAMDKLYTIDPELTSDRVERGFQISWAKRSGRSRRPLLWSTAHSVRITLAGFVAPRLCLSALKLCQPLLINRVTSWLSGAHHNEESDTGRGLIGATACIYLGLAIMKALFNRQLHRLITKVRGIMISAIHTKSLSLSVDSLSDSAALTLVSADVNRICSSMQRIDDLFATPLEVAVAIYLLRTQIGVSCVAPVAFVVVISVVSFINSNNAVPLQRKWLAAVQERISYTSAVLGCPKGFKMLGLTDFLSDRIQALRIKELVDYAGYRKYVTHRNTFSAVPQAFAPPLTLMMFTLLKGGQSLTPTVAFTTLSLVALLASPVQDLIHAVPMFQTALASLYRIQNFLLLDVLEQTSLNETLPTTTQHTEAREGPEAAIESAIELVRMGGKARNPLEDPAVLIFDSVSVSVGKEKKLVLKEITLKILHGTVTLVAGPVGSGKSTLLKALVGAVGLSDGKRLLRYSECAFAYCAQDPWLPNGTMRGLVLAQSPFDPAWYAKIVAACALDTDIVALPSRDETFIGTKGVALSGGQRQRLALARALYARRSFLVVDDVLSGLDASTSKHVFHHVFGPQSLCKEAGMTVVLATHSVHYLREADYIVALGPDGAVVEQGTFPELDLRKGHVHHLKATAGQRTGDREAEEPALVIKPAAPNTADVAQQDLARRTGDIAVYGYYARSIGWKYGIMVVLTGVTFAFGMQFPNVWVRFWAESEVGSRPKNSLGVWIGVSMLLAGSAIVSVFAQIWVMLVKTVPVSSAQLHKQLLHTVMRAPYSFFVNTDSGITLNRFSNDMSAIETDLAGAVMQTIGGAASCIAAAILIAAGSAYVGVTIPFILAVLYVIQRFYLRTSRQLRFMDLEAQAPLITHISETLAGVTTIRAFGWEEQCHQKCLDLLDTSQRPYYLMLCIQRWLNLVLDLTTAAIATIVVALAMTLQGTSSAGSIGVSLLSILSFNTNLAYLIVSWTTLETSLGAVARCKNFEASTTSEDKPGEDHEPPQDWPQNGRVEIQNVIASYNNDGGNVLKEVTLSVGAGQKIGICGRSGSGKSSLLLTLLRLLDISSGSIVIDGVDLATIPRQAIRSRLTALPQEAITVPGSLRDNIDPLGVTSEAAIRAALEKVGLLTMIEERGGLDSAMSEISFSQGQMQLFAVARALLRQSKILVLDEMTSSVDAQSEELMMSLMMEDFKDSTVIAVAHRLQTIANFDQVAVMDKGVIVEVGPPRDLLQKENGRFKSMWEHGGH